MGLMGEVFEFKSSVQQEILTASQFLSPHIKKTDFISEEDALVVKYLLDRLFGIPDLWAREFCIEVLKNSRCFLNPLVRVWLWCEVAIKKPFILEEETFIPLSACKICLEANENKFLASIEARKSNTKLRIIEEGIFMNAKEEGFPIKLVLGAIALGMDSLMNLEPGITIEFEVPSTFEGFLQVGGIDWAKVSINITQDSFKIKIVEILSNFFQKGANIKQ